MSARGPAVDRLLPLDGLPALDVPAAEVLRARELTARHGMQWEREVDLADPVITRVERFAAERDRPAVADGARALSYAELAARARRLATLLENEGVEPGTVVGVGGPRSADVIAAFLAIELIGALYVPADETWPAGRVRDVLDQAGASVLIAAEDAGALAEGAGGGRLPHRALRRGGRPGPLAGRAPPGLPRPAPVRPVHLGLDGPPEGRRRRAPGHGQPPLGQDHRPGDDRRGRRGVHGPAGLRHLDLADARPAAAGRAARRGRRRGRARSRRVRAGRRRAGHHDRRARPDHGQAPLGRPPRAPLRSAGPPAASAG